ncbi:MAG: hypothetical protein U5Q03_04170 [Bacteroidota bacterium]|nr:hypothetical protein [Bacteroidota bacterium]
MLDAVGMGILRKNNLLPTQEMSVKVKDVYEAFIRYDDKPVVNSHRAIQESLLKYCYNGEYAIATGDEKNWTRLFYKESVPFFDVMSDEYWLVDKSYYKPPKPEGEEEEGKAKPGEGEQPYPEPGDNESKSGAEEKSKPEEVKKFKR